VALLGFTSGSTGSPRRRMHFHRDLLIIADGYAREVLGVTPDDVFVGSPPLAFTFGLGGLAIFPLRFGAAATLLETAPAEHDRDHREPTSATVCFTAPTAYRVMLRAMDEGADLSSLRAAVSAGETLPAPVYEDWQRRPASRCSTGSARPRCCTSSFPTGSSDHKPACTGRPVTGYEAKVVGPEGNEVPPAGRPAGGARADRLPLPRRRTPEGLRASTAGTSPATASSRTRTAISISPPATTT
jgi:2-aminobenzoate-CoA ligase